MSAERDPAGLARAILDANSYMTIATADEDGLPWASPVWFARADMARFLWVSRPEARHSRNLAVRREVGIVVFDSQAPISTGRGVYAAATAERVPEAEIDAEIEVFSRRSQSQGAREWTRADVEPPSHLRLYRAVASELFVLDEDDRRVPVAL